MADPVVLVGKRPSVASQPTAGMGLALDMGGKFSSGLMSGSVPYSQLTLANSIVNADINTAAAIAASKLAGYPTDASKGLDGAGNWTGGMFKLYDLILSSSAANFDYTPIPGTFAHLRVVAFLRTDQAAAESSAYIRLNNDGTGNYDYEIGYYTAAAAAAAEGFAQTSVQISLCPANTATANTLGLAEFVIPYYAASTPAKDYQSFWTSKSGTGSGAMKVGIAGGVWRSTAAVTRITVLPGGGNFVAPSRVTVYGMGV